MDQQGVTQTVMGRQLGVSTSHVSQWLNGKLSAASSHAMELKIAAYFGRLSGNAATRPQHAQTEPPQTTLPDRPSTVQPLAQPHAQPSVGLHGSVPQDAIMTDVSGSHSGPAAGSTASSMSASAGPSITTTARVPASVDKTEAPCPELGDGWRVVSVKRMREVDGQPVARSDKYYVGPSNGQKYDSLKKARVAAMELGASASASASGRARARAGAGADVSPGAALATTPLVATSTAPPITANAHRITAAPSPASAAAPVPAAPATSAIVTDGAGHLLSAGARVKGRYLASSMGKFGTKWWPATVRHVHPDGACDLLYADGDLEDGVKPEFVRPFPIL